MLGQRPDAGPTLIQRCVNLLVFIADRRDHDRVVNRHWSVCMVSQDTYLTLGRPCYFRLTSRGGLDRDINPSSAAAHLLRCFPAVSDEMSARSPQTLGEHRDRPTLRYFLFQLGWDGGPVLHYTVIRYIYSIVHIQYI